MNPLETIKKQALELDKRRLVIENLEEKLIDLAQDFIVVSYQLKKAEAMLENCKKERKEFLEENQALELELRNARTLD